MPLYRVDPEPVPEIDDDDSSTSTVNTPPTAVDADLMDANDPLGGAGPGSPSVPWPGSTFIIRSVSSGHVITLLNGQIKLIPDDGHGSIHWECVETKGWLGFRNIVSGKFLGHGAEGRLRCLAEEHKKWEYFCVRMRPEGGCVLLMTHYERLWHVGIYVEQKEEKLAKIKDGASGGVAWEFVKV